MTVNLERAAAGEAETQATSLGLPRDIATGPTVAVRAVDRADDATASGTTTVTTAATSAVGAAATPLTRFLLLLGGVTGGEPHGPVLTDDGREVSVATKKKHQRSLAEDAICDAEDTMSKSGTVASSHVRVSRLHPLSIAMLLAG